TRRKGTSNTRSTVCASWTAVDTRVSKFYPVVWLTLRMCPCSYLEKCSEQNLKDTKFFEEVSQNTKFGIYEYSTDSPSIISLVKAKSRLPTLLLQVQKWAFKVTCMKEILDEKFEKVTIPMRLVSLLPCTVTTTVWNVNAVKILKAQAFWIIMGYMMEINLDYPVKETMAEGRGRPE
ncbi:putative heat shock protein HSP 90-beta-3, partial [Galemys pyrenaicus]